MAERDWRPFVYGGLASCAAEFGKYCSRLLSVIYIKLYKLNFYINIGKFLAV